MPERSHHDHRVAIVEAAGVLSTSGVMSHAGHINLSTRIDDRRMMLTSSGLIAELEADRLAVVDLDGKVESGSLTACLAEVAGMHAAVYRLRRDVGSVLHTHSPHITTFALAHRPLPCRYEALLRRGQAQPVPVVPWSAQGSDAFFEGIADALHSSAGTNALLLANHGGLVFGASAISAVKLLITLEEAAELEVRAAALGGAKDLPTTALVEYGPTSRLC